MSGIPGVNSAYADEAPALATRESYAGSWWSLDWRDLFPIASDSIHNHVRPVIDPDALMAAQGFTSPSEWTEYRGQDESRSFEPGFATGQHWDQTTPNPAPLAVDSFDRHPDNGQAQLSGVSSIAALVPWLELPDLGIGTNDPGGMLPYHYDVGAQIDQGQAIGPRQVFRSPPTISDQTFAQFAGGY